MATLLTIDDSRMIRQIISEACSALECNTLEASGGSEALEVLEKHWQDVDLILLDWNMPEMNGMQVLRKIKADKRFAKIPVMMVSTESEKKNILEAVKEGAEHYMIKPFAIEELVAKIKECLP